MSAEEWAQGEIVRNLTELTKEVKDLAVKIEGLGDRFVTKELFELRLEHELNKLAGKVVSKRGVAALLIGASTVATGLGAILAVVLR